MKRLLITGFAPFGGDKINPAWQAVQALPETVGQWELVKREVPVTFRGAPAALFEAMDECEPDAVLMIGLAASRGAVTPERQGVNEMVARIPDNEGNQPQNEPNQRQNGQEDPNLQPRRRANTIREPQPGQGGIHL